MTDPLMRVITTGGVVDLEIPSPADRSEVGSHSRAVAFFLANPREFRRVEEFEGVEVRGRDPETGELEVYELETDPDVIEDRESEGDLDIDHIYPNRRR
jgi:hypothetical protein